MLETLNRDLGLRKLHKHVTMFYGVIDLRSHELCFSSAGQYPFPLFDDGDRVRALECSGRPLGLFADARFSRREVSLESTRRMLLVSDGILEVLPELPGQQKLDQLIATMRKRTTMDDLVQGFGLDPTAHRRDDATLLLVERRNSHA
jgi:serine phosphatase RsbU (regulator of sigma subunit)